MRKLFNKLGNMTLLQQMATIIFVFGGIFVFFFAVYLHGNIQDFVSNQCMSILERSQETIVTNIQTKDTGYSEMTYDSGVMHFVFVKGKLQSYYGSATYNNEFIAEVTEMANTKLEGWVESMAEIDGNKYYYRLQVVDRNTVVISLLNESYGNGIESSLLSRVSNNSAIIISVLFILLILWMGTIITPLTQIKAYIEKVQKGDENATLNLERGDEIGEVATALVKMNEEIKNQEATKEEMIHNISHDLKTPIAVIKSYAESIKDGIYPYDTLDKSVDVIIENAERLESKVQSLLFLNRLDYVMDQEKETDKTTDMVSLVKSITTSMKMIRTEITVEKYLQMGAVFKGDEESWRVVVSNLLDNALRYAKTRVVIDLHEDTITVFNDGDLISEAQMQKLFKPFEKGDKGKFGLGLSICAKVCATYGYSIEAENMPNGVIFIIAKKKENEKEKKSRKA